MLTLPLSLEILRLRGWEKEPTPLKKKSKQFFSTAPTYYILTSYIFFFFKALFMFSLPIEYKLNEGGSML